MDIMLIAKDFFLDPKKSYALLLLIIFLLLYFIKPKPRYQMMPTLMFLFKDMGRNRTSNFLRNLITNILFLFQLIILTALLLSVAKPYIEVSKESLFKNTVIVLDVSASMNSQYEGATKFEKAKEIALDNLGSVNTLILVKKNPDAALVDTGSGDIRDYLAKLKPTDGPTNLYSAISAAGSYAKSNARVVVISDFLDTTVDADLGTVKKTLESQGIKVDFIKLQSNPPNIGIVDLTITESKTTAVIKNYNSQDSKVRMKINDLSEDIVVKANSKEVFTFTTPPKTSKLEMEVLEGQDSFKTDNTAYISAPDDTKKKILIITNNADYKNTYLYNALDVMKGAEVTVAIPPKIPDLSKYDVYVFKGVEPNLILPGTFKGVKTEVEENGKAAIIMAQVPATFYSINYQGLMMFDVTGEVSDVKNIIATSNEGITSNLEFGTTKKSFTVTPISGRQIAVLAADDNKNALIAYSKLGKGSVLYYGILDEYKEAETFFAKSPGYFVFWKRSLDLITNTPSVNNLNYKTGSYVSFPQEETIKTPEGTIKTKELSLDHIGLYTLQDRTIAINLIDEKESDIAGTAFLTDENAFVEGEKFKEKVPFELTDYLLYLAIVILFIELLYIKFRGDF